jgi:hypothetical protein
LLLNDAFTVYFTTSKIKIMINSFKNTFFQYKQILKLFAYQPDKQGGYDIIPLTETVKTMNVFRLCFFTLRLANLPLGDFL